MTATKYAKRGSLKPGQVFAVDESIVWRGYKVDKRQVCIVVGKHLDQDILTGAFTAYGEVMSDRLVEVLL